MEPEPVRQFVSKAARFNARAAFELMRAGGCAPIETKQNVGRYFDCHLLAPCGLHVARPA